jgi:DNA polymerase-3 subunit chi
VRVDFYVLAEASAAARLKVACRIAEKAYLASQSVLVWHSDRGELETMDQLLWTFADTSFVPHEWLGAGGPLGAEAPVLLATTPAGAPMDVLINLDHSAEPPPFLARIARVAEIIDGEPSRRDAGRARFKAYRQRGLSPDTHTLQAC